MSKCCCINTPAIEVGFNLKPWRFLMGIALFFCETAIIHLTHIFEVVSSALDTLVLDSYFVVKMFLSAERRGTVSSALSNPRARSPGP